MNDFLARLAARQRGDIATVSPRLPLRFAPVIELPPDEAVLPVSVTSAERRAVAQGAPPSSPPPAPLVTPAVAAAPPVAAQLTSPIAPAGGQRPDRPPRPEPVLPSSSPASIPEPRPAVPLGLPEPASRPAVAEPAVATAPAVPHVGIADPPPHEDPQRAAAAPPPPLVAPHRHVVTPVDPSPFAEAPRSQGPAGPPTVTVTIGRLEVRAAPAPPTAVRTTSARPPAPSLEEYLDRRQARRR